ncbi:MAG: hypothetical protein R3C59_29665 [Planctomycetaceae bacterium]
MDQLAKDTNRSRDSLRLLLATGALCVVWLIILPWWAHRPAMDEQLRFLKERGIDPSAMFYTELEAMEPILQRLESRRKD